MISLEDKENVVPPPSPGRQRLKDERLSPAAKPGRKGRSKSIGPGGLEEAGIAMHGMTGKQGNSKNRRKSTYVPAAKSIISADNEKAERQAARRKTLANRRVSFAPEATLHTWDVIEFMRDPTTSTESPGSTHGSGSRAAHAESPRRGSSGPDSDPPSTPPQQGDDQESFSSSPAADDDDRRQKKYRRSSGIPPMNFNNPDDFSSEMSGSSDASDSEDGEAVDSENDTGTAMSIDTDNATLQSMAESSSSTDSSARLEAALRQAAHAAGTRGIEYDEYGEDVSMEMAGDEVTNALKPWASEQAAAQPGALLEDQENVNPFSSAYQAHLISGVVRMPGKVVEEHTDDLSMDMTRAVGGIVQASSPEMNSSPVGDGTMDLTQAVGAIHSSSEAAPVANRSTAKRRRSTTETGSPGADTATSRTKRRRSSVARSSIGDASMELTLAVGGIERSGTSPRDRQRRSMAKRRSSAFGSDDGDLPMDITRAIGSIQSTRKPDQTVSSVDENEELTMELTTALMAVESDSVDVIKDSRPNTPQKPQSPVQIAANVTPSEQQRFRDADDFGPQKLLTPIFEQHTAGSGIHTHSAGKSPLSQSATIAQYQLRADERSVTPTRNGPNHRSDTSPTKSPSATVKSASPRRLGPTQSPSGVRHSVTPDSLARQQINSQLLVNEPSPTILKQLRSSPSKLPSTPDRTVTEPTLRLADSIKLMSTPRKDTLKNMTRNPSSGSVPSVDSQIRSPPKLAAPVTRRTPTNKQPQNVSPAVHKTPELLRVDENRQVPVLELQEFLDLAGIRFMDLTTTKRRLTTATTPSKARRNVLADETQIIDLPTAIATGGCTSPELEMFEHACHELRRYISDGKKVIKELETQTAAENPPLIRAYAAGHSNKQTAIDAQMRDIKTNARLRSKEMWYAWRSQLLKDLMKGLQSVGEGLISDDDILQRLEQRLEHILPDVIDRHSKLHAQAQILGQQQTEVSEEEKVELNAAREQVGTLGDDIGVRRKLLESLQREASELDSSINDLEETRSEFSAAIKEADRIKEASRGISLSEVDTLKESVRDLEQTTGWSLVSASSSPPSVTMTYKSQLQLFFHPSAFRPSALHAGGSGTNAPISLSYLPAAPLSTTLRFFLQLLRASLHAIAQCRTRVVDVLAFISDGWDIALAVAEAERQLNLEGMVESRILSDEKLSLAPTVLIPEQKCKIRVILNIVAGLGGNEAQGPKLMTTVSSTVKVVYGGTYKEKELAECLRRADVNDFQSWSSVVKQLRGKLAPTSASR